MKGTLGIVTALVAVNLLGIAVFSRAVAPPAAPPARVAVLNLTYVVKNYHKFERFQAQLKKAVEPFQRRDDEWKKRAETVAKELTTADAAQKVALEKELKALERKIEDNKAEASQDLNKKQEEQLQALYADVAAACRRQAKAKGYDLVLHYNDALNDHELRSGPNIARKMQAGALMPVYSGPGVDVSEAVVADLNDRLRRSES